MLENTTKKGSKIEVEEGDSVRVTWDRKEIHEKTMNRNKYHFSKLMSLKACDNKTHEKMSDEATSELILSEELKREEYTNP